MADLDAVLQSVCPTVMVPRYVPFEPLAGHGHRFLAARDGLHIEARRSWLHAILPVGSSAVQLPYGAVTPQVRFRLHGLAGLVARFIAEARMACPMEHAAWLLSDPATGHLQYAEGAVISQGPAHIRYRRPKFSASQMLAVDLHSHGRHEAGFSSVDDEDAADDAKLEIVIGNLDAEICSVACRLSLMTLKVDYSKWLASILYDESIEEGA